MTVISLIFLTNAADADAARAWMASHSRAVDEAFTAAGVKRLLSNEPKAGGAQHKSK